MHREEARCGDSLMSEQYHGDVVILMESSDGAKPGIRKARTNDFNEIQKSRIPSEAMTRRCCPTL